MAMTPQRVYPAKYHLQCKIRPLCVTSTGGQVDRRKGHRGKPSDWRLFLSKYANKGFNALRERYFLYGCRFLRGCKEWRGKSMVKTQPEPGCRAREAFLRY